jgi:hypothetical protein
VKYEVIGQGFSAVVVSGGPVPAFVVVVLVGLEYGVEEALPRLDLFVGDVLDCAGRLAEGLLGALALLVEVHFCLPGVEGLLALVEDHQQLQ